MKPVSLVTEPVHKWRIILLTAAAGILTIIFLLLNHTDIVIRIQDISHKKVEQPAVQTQLVGDHYTIHRYVFPTNHTVGEYTANPETRGQSSHFNDNGSTDSQERCSASMCQVPQSTPTESMSSGSTSPDSDSDSDDAIDVVYTWVNGTDSELFYQTILYKFLRPFTPFEHALSGSTLNRFADHDELRYSLRSLERFAPWVRNIYIVTNGQRPYWLNEKQTRVRVISHKAIFKDSKHLPVFASPAIEANLHRIPGLSRRFLYFNDDVFLTSPSSRTDFLLPDDTSVIYRGWPAPECSTGCSWRVGDGYCDHSCNVSQCDYDGGDCPPPKFHRWSTMQSINKSIFSNTLVCADFCHPMDLGNGICEPNCNIPECIFDLFDCGEEERIWTLSQRLSWRDSNQSSKGFQFILRDVRTPLIVDLSPLKSTLKINQTTSDLIVYRCDYLTDEGANRIRTILDHGKAFEEFELEQSTYIWVAATSQSQQACVFLVHPERVTKSFKLHTSIRAYKFSENKAPVLVYHTLHTIEIFVPDSLIPHSRTNRSILDFHVLDAYGAALAFTSQLMFRRFGARNREVVAHAPLLLDREVLYEIERTLRAEWDATSASRFRLPKNFQYQFLYGEYITHAADSATPRDAAAIFRKRLDVNYEGYFHASKSRVLLSGLLRYSTLDLDTLVEVHEQSCGKHVILPLDTYQQHDIYDEIVRCELQEMLKKANSTDRVDENSFLQSRVATLIQNELKQLKPRKVRNIHGNMYLLSLTNDLAYMNRTFHQVRSEHRQFLCINDVIDYTKANVTEARDLFWQLMNDLFPTSGPFEL